MTKKSNSEIVLEAIKDLHAQEQIVTRETLSDITGLRMSIIDDQLKAMVDDGLIHRVQRGVFVPAPNHGPSRLISKLILPDGTVKLEIGDDVLTLTPRESRMLGELMAGSGMQFSAIELGHQSALMSSELSLQIKKVRREMSEIRDLLFKGQVQGSLHLEEGG